MKTTITKKLNQVLENGLKLDPSEANRKLLTEMIKKPLLTNSDFVMLFQIDVRSCYRWRKKDNVPHLKISGRIYYYWNDVLALMDSKKIIN